MGVARPIWAWEEAWPGAPSPPAWKSLKGPVQSGCQAWLPASARAAEGPSVQLRQHTGIEEDRERDRHWRGSQDGDGLL
ncbi:hypothetical protein NDU88_004315 [Pleurodeles waltl]|uniref:Uncharacterized protein n=1 Tax=Pleurodeles waltl TaxID=8319 RepID=A0AAV7TT57_PLEWA|nr:hypothetical protein NDU88_004315 [Pleurodeles waltl]